MQVYGNSGYSDNYSFSRNYRPLIKEMDVWPQIHIDSRSCPFDQDTQVSKTLSAMDSKLEKKKSKGKQKQSGNRV